PPKTAWLRSLIARPAAAVGHRAVREALVSAALVGAARALDRPVGTNFPEHGVGLVFEEPGELVGSGPFLVGVTGAFEADGRVSHRPPLARRARELAEAGVLVTAGVQALKVVVGR